MPTILITGGSRGLGANTARRIAAAGHDVILTYRKEEVEAAETVSTVEAAGRKAKALQLDVERVETFTAFADAVRDALAAFGTDRLDGLLNNAGIGLATPIGDVDADTADTLYRIHLRGPAMLTDALLPLMGEGSRIVNVSSGLARFTLPGYAIYGSLKAAVEQLTRYQAAELGPRGISVKAIAPGATETDFGGGAVRDDEGAKSMVESVTAMGRTGQPDDIGKVMAWLLSADAHWITGETLEAGGGMKI